MKMNAKGITVGIFTGVLITTLFFLGGHNYLYADTRSNLDIKKTKRYQTASKVLSTVTKFDSIRLAIKAALNANSITQYDSFFSPINLLISKKEIDSLFQSANPSSRLMGLLGLDVNGFIHLNFVRVDSFSVGIPPGGLPNYKWTGAISGSIQDQFPPENPPIPGSGQVPRPQELSNEYLRYILGL